MGDIRLIEIREDILSDNRELASELRARLARHKTYLLNLMSSPGSGKTSLILRTVDRLKDRFRIGVLEADIDSIVDAERVAASGVQAVQLRTGGFCHLDAGMVAAGLEAFDLDALDRLLTPEVKLFAFGHGSNTLGIVNDAADLCARARKVGAIMTEIPADRTPLPGYRYHM